MVGRADNDEGNSTVSLQSNSYNADEATTFEKPADDTKPITTSLSSAGHILEEVQAEVVLQPLRLAFETKNIKLMEPALDCLHV